MVCFGLVCGSCFTAARNWSFVPTTKLSPPWGDLVPFCIPTTDMEQPFCSHFPMNSHFLTLSNTIRDPERRKEKAFSSLQQSYPSWLTQLVKIITGMWLGDQLQALNLLEKYVSRFRQHFPIGKARRI